jgi:drug/metabolite transporter (DMT)-like permease
MMQRLSGNAIAFIAMILWATQFPATAMIIDGWDPILMSPFRAGFSGIFLLLALLVTGGAHNLARARWRHVWWLGCIVLAISTVLFIWGQKYTHPITAAVIISMMPLISAAMGFLSRREQLTLPIVVGIVLALAGGYLTNLEPGAGLFGFGFQGGEPYMFASVVLFVWYSRETAERLGGISELAQAAFTLALAALGTAIFAFGCVAAGIVEPVYDLSLRSLGILAWCGAIAIGLAMALWFAAIKRIGTTITTMHHNLVPFYVILFSTLSGGVIYQEQAWGAFLVFLGAALAQIPITGWMRRRALADPA